MDHRTWFVLGVLLGNGIGALLAVFCLTRMTSERRTSRNRLLLAAVAAWALVETARDDMFFVAASAIDMGDYEVRFFLAPSMALTAVTVAFTTGIFRLAATRRRPSWTIAAGMVAGLLMTAMCLQSAFSGRSGSALSIDAATAAAIAAGLGVATGAAVWLAAGKGTRSAQASAVALLAVGLTIAQYLIADEITVDPDAVLDSTAGVTPVALVIFTAVAFGLRAIALTIMTMIDDNHAEP